LSSQRGRILRGEDAPAEEAGDLGKVDVNQLRYGEDNGQIRSILLALSVFQGVRGGRFNFHAFREEQWSLEHIFPQSPFGKGNELGDEQRTAALDILTQNGGEILKEETREEIARLNNTKGNDGLAAIDVLLKTEPLLHQIGNLCLLGSGDNSAMGCGMFNEKRAVIRDRIARGSFVPRHTYEVFSRMIVGDAGSLDVWSKLDIQTHQAEIQKRLTQLMKEDA